LSAWPWLELVSSNASGGSTVLILKLSISAVVATLLLLCRILVALDLQSRLTQAYWRLEDSWLVPLKDLLQAAIWMAAFLGNQIEWRGDRYRLRRNGTMEKL
jgi:ceramide glucosyltransferase